MTAPEVLTGIPPLCRNPKCRAVRHRRASGEGIEGACDYCRACYDRWRKAGRPASGPPDPRPCGDRAAAVNAERQRDAAERMAEYAAYLRSGFSRETAARYVGVSADTGYRYESALRRQQVAA